jgi:hypothetical protein
MTDQYAVAPLPPSGPEREALVRDAILIGSLNEFMSYLPQTAAREERENALAEAEQAQALTAEEQDEVRACTAQILVDGISRLSTRLDAFEKARSLAAKRAQAEQERRDRQRVAAYLDGLPDPDDEPYSFDVKERMAAEREAADQDPGPQDPNLMGEVYDPEPRPAPGSRLYPPHPGIPQPVSISLNSEEEAKP